MTTHPIDTFELRQDLAAVRQLHADAAEAVALRAEVQRLRSMLSSVVNECNEHRNDDEAGWLACWLLALLLEVPR